MRIERKALVSHTALEMYRLVADVPAYPQFLSWCSAAVVHEQDETSQKAELTVSIAGIRQRFTTLNTLRAGESVEMRLLEGPFKSLQGSWNFDQLGNEGCRVSLVLEFEISAGPLAAVFGKGFGRIADRLVSDFCKRADTVYG